MRSGASAGPSPKPGGRLTCGVKGSSEPAVAGLQAPHAQERVRVRVGVAAPGWIQPARWNAHFLSACRGAQLQAPPRVNILKDSAAGRKPATGTGTCSPAMPGMCALAAQAPRARAPEAKRDGRGALVRGAEAARPRLHRPRVTRPERRLARPQLLLRAPPVLRSSRAQPSAFQ